MRTAHAFGELASAPPGCSAAGEKNRPGAGQKFTEAVTPYWG